MLKTVTTAYDSETRIESLYFCTPEEVRFRFDAADPAQPAQAKWELLEKERLYFADRETAIAVYEEYHRQGYLLDAVFDIVANQPILEQVLLSCAPETTDNPEVDMQWIEKLGQSQTGTDRGGREW